MMHFSLPITKHFFDFTLGCLWNVQIQKNEKKRKLKKKFSPAAGIEPVSLVSELNALPLFQADLL